MIAYFDCSAGISGDMCIGALVDAGVPLKEIDRRLRALPIRGYSLEEKRVKRASVTATKVDVTVKKSEVRSKKSGVRKWKDIKDVISKSSLPLHIRQKGLGIFKRLFDAEGKVHGEACHRTHLHELGAVDCLVDVFGVLIGLSLLGVDKVYSSAINLGSGSVSTEHGLLPVPAPATAEIIKGVPVYSSGIPFELTTPTGAAIVQELSTAFGAMPLMKVQKVGYGAGRRDIRELPNVLRIFIGEDASRIGPVVQKVTVIETNIDDMNPQLYEHVTAMLFGSGALDAYLTQVIMKKGRPGVLLTVLCHEEKAADIAEVLFRETTTIGVRFYEGSRKVLARRMQKIDTGFGKISVKVATLPDGTVKPVPEYEDCRMLAEKHGIPLIEVMRKIQRAVIRQSGKTS